MVEWSMWYGDMRMNEMYIQTHMELPLVCVYPHTYSEGVCGVKWNQFLQMFLETGDLPFRWVHGHAQRDPPALSAWGRSH